MSYSKQAEIAKREKDPQAYAEAHAIAKDQMWEDEATKYIFDDNSFLVVQGMFACAVDADDAASLREYRKFFGTTISPAEHDEINRLLGEIEDEA